MTTLDRIREIDAALARERTAYEVAESQHETHIANHHLLSISMLLRELDLLEPACPTCGLLGCDCDLPDDD